MTALYGRERTVCNSTRGNRVVGSRRIESREPPFLHTSCARPEQYALSQDDDFNIDFDDVHEPDDVQKSLTRFAVHVSLARRSRFTREETDAVGDRRPYCISSIG